MAEPADINVDELRRRARRRLVGAVVLALGVAVVVPMLLETEQKPLGEDVSVKIPPVDSGKFVNRLNDGIAITDLGAKAGDDVAKGAPPSTPAGGDAAPQRTQKYDTRVPAGEAAPTAPEPGAGTSAAPAESAAATKTDATSTATGTESSAPSRAAATKTESTESAKSAGSESDKSPGSQGRKSASSESARSASSESRKSASAESAKASNADSAKSGVQGSANGSKAASAAAHEGFAVQLAAFADDRGANSLAGRLKKAGYAAYTEPLKTSKGTLWRVRVGPFPSREAAVAARDKLKTEGQSGIVAAIK